MDLEAKCNEVRIILVSKSIAFCFEIHQLLRLTPRIFKHDLEHWPHPLYYIESRAISKDVASLSPWLYETKIHKNKGKLPRPLDYKRTKSRKFKQYKELTLIGSKVLKRTIKWRKYHKKIVIHQCFLIKYIKWILYSA